MQGLDAGRVPANHGSVISPMDTSRHTGGFLAPVYRSVAAAPQGAGRENQMSDWTERF